MNKKIPTSWIHPSSLEEATVVQKELADRIILEDAFQPIEWVGGMDVSNSLLDPQERVYAATVVLNKQTLKVKTEAACVRQQKFPYIPGFLGFREAPALLEAYEQLTIQPQIILIDGHGISHPRRLGIASHIGALLDIPTIGVAKSILVGKPEGDLGPNPGDQIPLIWKKECIGMLLRTKARCNPLIISSGHRISLSTAVRIVQECLKGYRLPEPTRQAHLAANAYRIRTA